MRIGLQVPSFTWPQGQQTLGDTFGAIARRAERAGFYSFWVMDHFFQIAFAAGVTNRIKLGTLVTGVTYRHPGILVKTATTLDVLSHGRAYFGVGAAWNEQEHKGLGVPFPPLAERFERLEETLRIALQMWEGDERPYEGKHYTLERPLNSPRAVQRPHPPIMIGGGGEQKTLRLVAQYADACNLFARAGDEALQHKLEVLQQHCDRLGRDYAAIEKTALATLRMSRDGANDTMTPAAAVDYLGHLAGMGFEHVIFNMPNVSDPEIFDILGEEVIPQVAHITATGR
jgi:F420-dependent oxidoreductase-like protein